MGFVSISLVYLFFFSSVSLEDFNPCSHGPQQINPHKIVFCPVKSGSFD